ncbi:MAG: dimethylmenaquinone methyltransferase [Bacteroidetes bacterium QH_8_67_23]|nr:MAG: dimethylmenaquinone methyltransferase [Bacteroidetes bacterium QH_8_67_23]
MSRFRPASVPTFALLLAGLVALSRPAAAQQQYLSPPDPTEVSDERLLEMYDGLRVADVSDGMDLVGLRNVGLMDPRIQSLWKDFEKLNHQFHGIALTVRYVPHDRVVSNPMPPDSFKQWKGRWYDEVSPEPFAEKIDPGSVVVIDASGDGDTGSVGSFNGLIWHSKGARGIVTTGSVRDTDELAVEEVPVYLNPKKRGRGIRPGRNMLESVNRPIEVGGALVQPGDVIVADGDGVIVVPREHAVEVARHACEVLEGDKAARRRLYERLGRPLDQTVRPGEETDEGDEP